MKDTQMNTTQTAEQIEAIKTRAQSMLTQCTDVVKELRDKLVKSAHTESYARLSTCVRDIAHKEGSMLVYHLIHTQIDFTPLHDITSELLLRGADDTWSGRGNDTERAHFDGVRESVKSVLLMWDYTPINKG